MGRWAKGILGPSKKQPAGAKLATQLDTQYKRNSAHEAEVLQQVSHSVSSPTTDFPSPPLPSTSRRCATKTSDSSLDSQAGFSPKDSFFPLPQSARFAKARFPFKPQKIDIDAQPLEWVPVPPKGRPPARGVCAHSTTRVGNALYVIGGCDSHGCLNTIRKLDLSTLQWTKLRPEYRSADHDESSSAKPPKLRAHTATRVHDCIVVYGGGNGPQYFGSIWVFNTSTEEWWRPNITGKAPAPRRAHAAVFDEPRGRICIFGGGDGREALNDVALLEVSDPQMRTFHWVNDPQPSTFPRPPPRGYHTLTPLDDNHAVLFGGSDGSVSYSDCHILDLASLEWQEVKLDSHDCRMSHAAVAIGSKLLVMGGHESSTYVSLASTLEIDLRSGKTQSRETCGPLPKSKGYFSANLHHDLVICIGGFDGKGISDETWALQLDASDWIDEAVSL